MKSIMQDDKECYITHSTLGLHRHHIFGGAFRDKSEEYGCWVWLRHDYHVGTSYAVHHNKRLMNQLRMDCQKKFEELYGHDKFMEVFRKDYAD